MYNKLEIKQLLSVKVLKNIDDKSIQNIVRKIIFSDKNIINWDEVIETMLIEMPELEAE